MSNTLPLIERELRLWPDVTYSLDTHSKRHPRIVLQHGDTRRFLCYSSTKVQSRGLLNKVSELRRTLHEIGATRERH